MRIPLYLVAVAALIPSAAGAQTTTADGVQALIRGDYQTAVRILRPLADQDGPQPDPLAQFFMAMLYRSGQGVPRNLGRACGLYLSAAKPANPLMNQSLDLARSMQQEMGPPGEHFCSEARADRWRDAPPASFTLGPGHTITIDDAGATVLYNGTQKHITLASGAGPGTVPLPSRYAPLDVSRPVGARRHFIEFFSWSPYSPFDPSGWTLSWSLSELVGSDLIPIAMNQKLVTITAPQPPMVFDVDSAAGVRVDANGEAEWVVRGGPNPRGALIPFRGPR